MARRRRKNHSIKDEALRERLCQVLQAGVSVTNACRFVDLQMNTYSRWKIRGKADIEAGKHTPYATFVEDVQRARARAETKLAAQLLSMAQNDGRLCLSVLARLYPEQWGNPGKRQTLAHERAMQAIELRKAEAEVRLAEARAAALEAAASQAGGAVMLMPHDLLHSLPESVRQELVQHLGALNVGLAEPPQFGRNVTPEEIETASPTPLLEDNARE